MLLSMLKSLNSSLLEKDLGRPVTHEELFKVCHTKTPKDSTDESWCETRAQQTHESFVQRIQEYRSTQPPESQDTPLTDEQVEQFWRESAGEPVRGSVYGYTQKAFAEKKPWFYCPSSSGFDNVDKAVVSVMKEKISMLTAELVASNEREKKRDEQIEQIAASKEIENKRYAELQSQLKSLFESGKIIPHCASDKRRCLVDESNIEGEEGEEDEDEDEDDDANDE